jgi:hypothetical protein
MMGIVAISRGRGQHYGWSDSVLGWRAMLYMVTISMLLLAPLILWLMRNGPADIGLTAYGEEPSGDTQPPKRPTAPSSAIAATFSASGVVGIMAQDSSERGSASTAAPHSGGASATARGRVPADANPHLPGATGDDIVRGDRSTIAGDRAATLDRRDGAE